MALGSFYKYTKMKVSFTHTSQSEPLVILPKQIPTSSIPGWQDLGRFNDLDSHIDFFMWVWVGDGL